MDKKEKEEYDDAIKDEQVKEVPEAIKLEEETKNALGKKNG